MSYQLNAIELKSICSLAGLIAAGSADAQAGDITVAYLPPSNLFNDTFLVSCIYNIIYFAVDGYYSLGLIHMKLGGLRKRSFQ